MPDFTIRDPGSGKTMTVRGDSPPTEQELEQLFAASGQPMAAHEPPAPAPHPNQELYDNMQGAGKWIARAIGGAFIGPAGVEAADNPGTTLLGAIPFGIGRLARSAVPFIGPAARGAAGVMDSPLGGAAIGGASGAIADGKRGAALGAIGGLATGPRLAKDLKRIANRFDPPKVPVTPPKPPNIIEGMSAIGKPKADNLAASARMIEGLSQRKPTPPPGARLMQGSRPPTLEQELTSVVDELRLPPARTSVAPSAPGGGSFTLPPDVPIPTDKTFKRIAPFAKNARARYRELTSKTILSPQEASELAQLEQVVKSQAQTAGMSYAAGGK